MIANANNILPAKIKLYPNKPIKATHAISFNIIFMSDNKQANIKLIGKTAIAACPVALKTDWVQKSILFLSSLPLLIKKLSIKCTNKPNAKINITITICFSDCGNLLLSAFCKQVPLSYLSSELFLQKARPTT